MNCNGLGNYGCSGSMNNNCGGCGRLGGDWTWIIIVAVVLLILCGGICNN